jgi:hypothetical protein
MIIANMHFVCAAGLLVCIVAVALSNAVRRDRLDVPGSGFAMTLPDLRAGMATLRPPDQRRPNVYAGFAWALVAVAMVGGIAVWAHLVSLFWLELLPAFVFILFWLAQTFAELPLAAEGGGGARRRPTRRLGDPDLSLGARGGACPIRKNRGRRRDRRAAGRRRRAAAGAGLSQSGRPTPAAATAALARRRPSGSCPLLGGRRACRRAVTPPRAGNRAVRACSARCPGAPTRSHCPGSVPPRAVRRDTDAEHRAGVRGRGPAAEADLAQRGQQVRSGGDAVVLVSSHRGVV